MSARIRSKSLPAIAREGFLDRRSKRCFWLLLSPQTKVARAGARNYPHRRQRKRAYAAAAASWFSPDGEAASGGHISFCEERNVKESRLDLRSKGPLARYELCKIGGADLAELVRRGTLLSVQGSLVPLAPLPLTAVRVGVGALVEWRLSNRAFGALRRQR